MTRMQISISTKETRNKNNQKPAPSQCIEIVHQSFSLSSYLELSSSPNLAPTAPS